MLKLDVFAGTIGNLTDARYFAAREAKWLGFNLDQMNPSSVSEMEVNAIKGWLDGVKIVGEFGDVSNDDITKAIKSLELDAVLAGPFTSKDAIESVEVPVFKEIVIESDMTTVALKELMEQYEGTVAHFVLDFDKNKVHPGNSEFSKEFLQDLSSQYSIIVSFPWEVYEIGAALEDADWSGILLH